MTATLEQVTEQLAKLTSIIQEKSQAGQNPKTELKWDDISADFQKEVDALVAKQVEEKLATQPQRPMGGDPIFSPEANELLKRNRYAKMVRDFEKDGIHKSGGQTFKPVDLFIAAAMMAGQEKNWHASISDRRPMPMSDDLKNALKAMTSTGVGTGDELVPTNLMPQLWEDFFLASRVVSMLQRVEMTSDPFDIPLGLGDVVWRKGSQNTATTASDPATAKTTLTSTELVTQQEWSYTLDEDAIIAIAPALRARLAQSGGEIMDAFALNADATNSASGNINSDDGTPGAGSYYLTDGQDGIRHQWLVDAATAMGRDENGALEDATITAELAAMGKYAADPTNLAMICDVATYLTGFLATASGSPGQNVITVDKFGAGAVVLTGQLAAYRGIPIVISASHPLTEADGKVSATPSNNTKGSISIINRLMWTVGFRRNLLIETDRDITKRQYIMVTSLREAVACWGGVRANQRHTGGIFNITV